MGPRLFHQAHCMTFDSFSCMHHILLPYITDTVHKQEKYKYGHGYETKGGGAGGNYQFPPIPNGDITSNARLACALCYFAGSAAYDIAPLYGLSYSDVQSSV